MAIVRGGPGTSDPGRIFYEHVTLMRLISEAFDVYPDEVTGPEWPLWAPGRRAAAPLSAEPPWRISSKLGMLIALQTGSFL